MSPQTTFLQQLIHEASVDWNTQLLHLANQRILVLFGISDKSEHLREGLDVGLDFVLRKDGKESCRSTHHQKAILRIVQRPGNGDDVVKVWPPLQQIRGWARVRGSRYI